MRWAVLNPAGDDNTRHEIGIGFSVDFNGHKVSWQTDVTTILPGGGGENATEVRARTPLQLAF